MKTIFLIISLFLIGCKTPPPITAFYPLDVEHSICAKRLITDIKTLQSKHDKDLPISDCDGFVAIDYKEFLELKNWIVEAQKKFTEKDKERLKELSGGQ